MMTINVLPLGELKLNGHTQGHPRSGKGTFRLALPEGSTVQDVMGSMGLPSSKVAVTAINGCMCQAGADLEPGDWVVLVPWM